MKQKKSIALAYVTPMVSIGSLKNVIQFGPAVWPAIANIYTNIQIYINANMSEEIYYKEDCMLMHLTIVKQRFCTAKL